MNIRDNIVPLLPVLSMRARKLTRNGAWEDLLHDTIAKALDHESQFKPGTNIRAWLYTIMRNEFINQRRRGPQEPVEPNSPIFLRLEALSAREARDRLIDVQRKLDMAPKWARQIVDSAVRHDFDYEDVGAELHLKNGTVKSRLWRARELLA